MGKLKDEIISLELRWDQEYKEYQNKANEIDKDVINNADKFLSAMYSINSKRLDINQLISNLYSFLKKHEHILKVGNEVLPKDYTNETPNSYNKPAYAENRNPHNFPDDNRSNTEKFIDYCVMGRTKYGHMEIKRMYPLEETKYREDKDIWEKDLADRRDILRFYKIASRIANLYLETVMSIQYTIEKIIIPKIYVIESFLYAYGIAECIREESNPAFSHQANLVEFNNRSSPYNQYFVFMINASDFYKEMKVIFCKPIITNLLNRKMPSERDIKDFEKVAASIQSKRKFLENKS